MRKKFHIQVILQENYNTVVWNPEKEFFEYVERDLKHITSDLAGFLDVYYPMLKSVWKPEAESEFIIGWMIGTKEQEYAMSYFTKYKKRIGEKSLFKLHRMINEKNEILEDSVNEYLKQKEN